MDYNAMKRIPVDPRVVDLIQRSPTMRYEQGENFMSNWGGPVQYQMLVRLPREQRLCYVAVLEGAATEDQVEVVTGLSSKEVSRGLEGLQERDLVTIEIPSEV